MRALIVEDEPKMANLLRRGLLTAGYAVDVASNGEDAVWMANATEYDAIVLDVMLPRADGFAVCQRLREQGVWTPVLMLTARDAIEDRVAGLDTGADDYMTKPFSLSELLARLRALSRRGPVEQPPVLEAGSLRLDPSSRQAWRGTVEIELSTKEFSLLETLMRRAGQIVSRYDLLEHAWDFSYENRSNVVDVYVHYLRDKIDRPFGLKSIETVRGSGYRLRKDGGAERDARPRADSPASGTRLRAGDGDCHQHHGIVRVSACRLRTRPHDQRRPALTRRRRRRPRPPGGHRSQRGPGLQSRRARRELRAGPRPDGSRVRHDAPARPSTFDRRVLSCSRHSTNHADRTRAARRDRHELSPTRHSGSRAGTATGRRRRRIARSSRRSTSRSHESASDRRFRRASRRLSGRVRARPCCPQASGVDACTSGGRYRRRARRTPPGAAGRRRDSPSW